MDPDVSTDLLEMATQLLYNMKKMCQHMTKSGGTSGVVGQGDLQYSSIVVLPYTWGRANPEHIADGLLEPVAAVEEELFIIPDWVPSAYESTSCVAVLMLN